MIPLRTLLPLALAAGLGLLVLVLLDPLAGGPADEDPDRARREALAVLAGDLAGAAGEAPGTARATAREGRDRGRPGALAPGLTGGAAPRGTGRPAEAGARGPGRRAVTVGGPTRTRTWVGEVRSGLDGDPVPGAVVTLTLGPERSEATTDDEGIFRVGWFPDEPADLEITHEALVDLRVPGLELEDDARFVLDPSGALAGHLTGLPPGTATEDLRVELWRQTSKRGRDWPGVTGAVTPEGAFRFDDLDPGEYALCAFGTDLAGRYESGVVVASGAEARRDLELRRGARVLGTLVAPPGLEVPDLGEAELELTTRDKDLPRVLSEALARAAVPDADGAFELEGLPAGAYRLTVTTPWGSRLTRGVDVTATGEDVELEVEVTPPAGLGGRVVDADGDPVPGVLVIAQRKGARLDLDGPWDEAAAEAGARTDGDGRFLLERVPAEQPIQVVVPPAPDVLPTWSTALSLAPGELRQDLELVLPAGTYVTGRISRARHTAATGEHLAGARVRALLRQAGREVTLLTTTTDEEGRYRLGPLLPRRTRIAADLDGFLPGSETLDLLPAEEHVLDLWLEPAWTLRGRVVDEDGVAVPALRLAASVTDLALPKKERRARTEEDPPDRETRTDPYGRFVLRELPPADWLLSPRGGTHELVERRPRVVTDAVAAAGTELVVVVRRLPRSERATLAFEVLAASTGRAPQGLVVGGARDGQVTIDDGRVYITGLAPEAHRIALAADDCASTYLDVQLFPGVDTDLGLVQLDPGSTVVARVSGPDADPLTGAKVRLLPLPVGQGGPVLAGALAGPEPLPGLALEHRGGGRYRAEGVPQGGYRLRVSAPGFRARVVDLEVDEPREASDVVLKVKGPAGVRGR